MVKDFFDLKQNNYFDTISVLYYYYRNFDDVL
jgi:hypothetical protein